jgi:nitrite reductase/ring-hydroxylating ferredoxin subunit
LYDDPIPEGFFPDIIINLSFPEYAALNSDGNAINIDGGVRGIVLYRKSALIYIAYERNCSFHPNDACATIEVHSSKLFLIDTCCGSSFDLDEGSPTGGPAWRPLRKYRTFLDGTNLTITSESLNGM